MFTVAKSASKLPADGISPVRVRGKNLVWPNRCVGCAKSGRLAKKELCLHAQDGGLNSRELRSIEPASTIVTWSYPICRLCSTKSPRISHRWYVGDATAIVSAVASILASTLGDASALWVLVATAITALYGATRFVFVHRFRVYLASLPKRNETGTFVKCVRVIGLDGKAIRGFDNFVDLLRRGDVICEFDFRNRVVAENFRNLNTPT